MRRNDRELTKLADLEYILQNAFVCHLGLVDEDRPYVVPMNYVYIDGHIYLHGAAEGRKIDIIKKNNKVCFEMELFDSSIVKGGDDPCDWGTIYKSVIGFGKASLLESYDEKSKALELIVKRMDDRDFVFPEAMVTNTAVIDILITEMTGKVAND